MIDDIDVVALAAGKGVGGAGPFEAFVANGKIDQLELAGGIVVDEQGLAVGALYDLVARSGIVVPVGGADGKAVDDEAGGHLDLVELAGVEAGVEELAGGIEGEAVDGAIDRHAANEMQVEIVEVDRAVVDELRDEAARLADRLMAVVEADTSAVWTARLIVIAVGDDRSGAVVVNGERPIRDARLGEEGEMPVLDHHRAVAVVDAARQRRIGLVHKVENRDLLLSAGEDRLLAVDDFDVEIGIAGAGEGCDGAGARVDAIEGRALGRGRGRIAAAGRGGRPEALHREQKAPVFRKRKRSERRPYVPGGELGMAGRIEDVDLPVIFRHVDARLIGAERNRGRAARLERENSVGRAGSRHSIPQS